MRDLRSLALLLASFFLGLGEQLQAQGSAQAPLAGDRDAELPPVHPLIDADYDKLPAGVEFQLGTSDSNADTDGDGEGDYSEVRLGTDPLDASSFSSSAPLQVQLDPSGPEAPEVRVLRDDRVATVELDYVPGNPWTPFELGADGLGAVGYRVSWWPEHAPSQVQSKLTSLRRVQIQPLWNGVRYMVRVDTVNRLGGLGGSHAQGLVHGGSDARLRELRSAMTGFFDDFNAPAGLPDELGWNTTFSKVNDPGLQAFFINGQFHSHTLVGTPPLGFGDRGQTVHRVRPPMHLGAGETRRIVFDLDGVDVGLRTVWYLDLMRTRTDITSHFSIDGGPGFVGHPSPGLRFKLVGQELSLWSLNPKGEQILILRNSTLDWDGRQTFPNVRRAMEVQVTEDHASLWMDGQLVLDAPLDAAALEPGDYTVHWTAFGYNTMKVGVPYMLLHWDNFGFDGPPADEVVHNYRSGVAGTDYVQSSDSAPQVVEVMIPDALAPTTAGVLGQAVLHFTRQMETHSPAAWSPGDQVSVGGVDFPIPQPTSSATPALPLDILISANSPYSTSIELGTVGDGGTAPLVLGMNPVVFRAEQCGFHNVHVEVSYPAGSEPAFTPPQEIHAIPMHHHFPKVGLPARLTHVGGHPVPSWQDDLNDPAVFQVSLSGTVEVGALVKGDEFSGLQSLRSNFVGGQLAGSGENPGVRQVELWMRPDGGDASSAQRIGFLATDAEALAPQVSHSFGLDTSAWPNGVYELSLQALDGHGVPSVPGYSNAGFAAGSAAAFNGFYFPLHVEIAN